MSYWRDELYSSFFECYHEDPRQPPRCPANERDHPVFFIKNVVISTWLINRQNSFFTNPGVKAEVGEESYCGNMNQKQQLN